jgi:hypothetical protein
MNRFGTGAAIVTAALISLSACSSAPEPGGGSQDLAPQTVTSPGRGRGRVHGDRAHAPPGGAAEDLVTDAITEAAAKTFQSDSYKVSFKLSMNGTPAIGSVSIPGEGAIDVQGNRGRMSFDYSAIPGAPAQLTNMEMIFVGDILYLRSEAFEQMLPNAGRWVSLDVGKLARQGGAGAFGYPGLTTSDPNASMRSLRGLVGAKKVGLEEVRGVPTTHYRARVDLERAIKGAPQPTRRQLQALRAQMSMTYGSTRFPAEVWVDEVGLVRRMSYRFKGNEYLGTPGASFAMELFDFGAPVEVTAPPAAEVTDLSKLLEGSTGLGL